MADLAPPMSSYEYMLQHKRVYRARGKASANECSHCDARARDWAQIHGRSGRDPQDYMPLCRKCHIAYDGTAKAVAESNRRRKGIPLPEAHRRAIGLAKTGSRRSAVTRARISDAMRSGGKYKLSSTQVAEIRAAVAAGTSQASLARHYGVSGSTISYTVNGRKARS